jgi:PAS domain-containing protein
MNNLDKIRALVKELPVRDKSLQEKVEYIDILKELFIKSPQAMAIMEEDWRYLLVNELFATIYGCGSPEEMKGKKLMDILARTPETPLEEINYILNEKGIWEGIITLPDKEKGTFISKISLKKLTENNMVVCTCTQI